MTRIATVTGLGLICVALVACAAPDLFMAQEAAPRGEPLNIRHILGAYPNKRACVAYRAATNSCASIITSRVEGDKLISSEIAALQVAGSTSVQNIEIITRSALEGERACAGPQDVRVTGRDEMSEFTLITARELINAYGGRVCRSFYRSGDGYVISTVGANGEPLPPGDIKFQFIVRAASLRAR